MVIQFIIIVIFIIIIIIIIIDISLWIIIKMINKTMSRLYHMGRWQL